MRLKILRSTLEPFEEIWNSVQGPFKKRTNYYFNKITLERIPKGKTKEIKLPANQHTHHIWVTRHKGYSGWLVEFASHTIHDLGFDSLEPGRMRKNNFLRIGSGSQAAWKKIISCESPNSVVDDQPLDEFGKGIRWDARMLVQTPLTVDKKNILVTYPKRGTISTRTCNFMS